MNKISVIIPTYNCAEFIEEAIHSVLKQTLLPYEIIVVDDGSTDQTAVIISGFNDARISYYLQENTGVAAARNLGLERASGDFIAFLDADDRWLPDMLARQYRALSCNSDLVFCFTNFVRFDDPPSRFLYPPQFNFYPELSKIITEDAIGTNVRIIKEDAFCQLVSFGEIPAYTQAIMLRASLVNTLRFNSGLKICEDAEFILRCSALGRVAFDETILLEVRRHQSNATKNISLIAVDKLVSLLKLREYEFLTSNQRVALEGRLTKAYWGAANVLARERLWRKSWHFVITAIYRPYGVLAKVRHLFSWLHAFVKSWIMYCLNWMV
jgi:glycosyltransferase involved in cell wall biosynthesis